MMLIPDSWGGDPLREYNDCHNPPGPDGGQFCSGSGGYYLTRTVNGKKEYFAGHKSRLIRSGRQPEWVTEFLWTGIQSKALRIPEGDTQWTEGRWRVPGVEKKEPATPLAVDDVFRVFVNQGYRDAMVLAVRGGRALAEVDVNGKTSLQFVDLDGGNWKSVSYRSVPREWLEAMVAEDVEWDGTPSKGARFPTPFRVLLGKGGLPSETLEVKDGDTYSGWHGTYSDRSGLDPVERDEEFVGTGLSSIGVWLSTHKRYTTVFGPKIAQFKIPPGKYLVYGEDPRNLRLLHWAVLPEAIRKGKRGDPAFAAFKDLDPLTTSESTIHNTLVKNKNYYSLLKQTLRKKGFDGILFKNTRIDQGTGGVERHDIWVVLRGMTPATEWEEDWGVSTGTLRKKGQKPAW